jgi:hypothetical protein
MMIYLLLLLPISAAAVFHPGEKSLKATKSDKNSATINHVEPSLTSSARLAAARVIYPNSHS